MFGGILEGLVVPQNLVHVCVELLASCCVHNSTHRPHEGLNKHAFQALLDIAAEASFSSVVHKALKEADKGEAALHVCDGCWDPAEFLNEEESRREKPVKEGRDEGCMLVPSIRDSFAELSGDALEPNIAENLPTKVSGLGEDDAETGDRCRRGLLQVLRLEHHGHRVRHFDNLSRHETELFVVIEDSVHVLDPDGIDRTVKKNPLTVR
mmetsp:Transcript_7185/g.14521  ORF Transcript_7185/g.14521 Transcript_7185/m.14521 type:complete len:209 (+) Transcript_7185:6677-7303(+)